MQLGGLKKPLNLLENPIYPDIKKGPPRFVWSRKHWDIDESVLRDTEPFTQFIEPAILTQSRDYNKTVYGQSSHKDIVNAEFRPPLISPYEDLGPLTRIPATIHAIIPHINPSTAGHGSGTSSYAAKNERSSDVAGALTDRIKTKESRPTFFAPIEIPFDNPVVPDFESKMPPVSAHAGWEIPIHISSQPREIDLKERLDVPIDTGFTTQIQLTNVREDYDLYEKIPRVSVTSGNQIPYESSPDFTFLDLEDNRPQVSVSAGCNVPMELDADIPVPNLKFNRPQVSVHSGFNTPVLLDGEISFPTFKSKIEQTPVCVLNPGSEDGFSVEPSMYSCPEDNITQCKPSYSYVVPTNVPFKSENERSHRPHFRERLQPLKSYGQISQSGCTIPPALKS